MSLRTNTQFAGATKPNAIDIDSYEPELSAKRVVEQPSNNQELIDLSNYPVIYVGIAGSGFPQAAGTDNTPSVPNWMIQSITIGASGITTQIGWGRWTARTTLTYL